MNDDDFLRAFLGGALPPAQFHHRDHLRLAWLLVRQFGAGAAGPALADGIRRYAAAHGQAARYHETLTQFWARLVGHMVRARPDIADFATFLVAFPQLLDKGLPYRHWHAAMLDGAPARAGWVEPDLLGLPQ